MWKGKVVSHIAVKYFLFYYWLLEQKTHSIMLLQYMPMLHVHV